MSKFSFDVKDKMVSEWLPLFEEAAPEILNTYKSYLKVLQQRSMNSLINESLIKYHVRE